MAIFDPMYREVDHAASRAYLSSLERENTELRASLDEAERELRTARDALGKPSTVAIERVRIDEEARATLERLECLQATPQPRRVTEITSEPPPRSAAARRDVLPIFDFHDFHVSRESVEPRERIARPRSRGFATLLGLTGAVMPMLVSLVGGTATAAQGLGSAMVVVALMCVTSDSA